MLLVVLPSNDDRQPGSLQGASRLLKGIIYILAPKGPDLRGGAKTAPVPCGHKEWDALPKTNSSLEYNVSRPGAILWGVSSIVGRMSFCVSCHRNTVIYRLKVALGRWDTLIEALLPIHI